MKSSVIIVFFCRSITKHNVGTHTAEEHVSKVNKHDTCPHVHYMLNEFCL